MQTRAECRNPDRHSLLAETKGPVHAQASRPRPVCPHLLPAGPASDPTGLWPLLLPPALASALSDKV